MHVLYRPPSADSKHPEATLRQVLLDFSTTHRSDHTTVVGDFNHMNTVEVEAEFAMKQVVHFNTRENAKLDLILTNCADSYGSPRKCSPVASSDHCVIEWKPAPCRRAPTEVLRIVTVYDRRVQYIQKAEDTIVKADWNSVFDLQEVEDSYSQFYYIVISALNCIPTRIVKITNHDPLWISGTIKDIQKRRDLAFRQNDIQTYKRLPEKLDQMIKDAKASMLQKSRQGTKE